MACTVLQNCLLLVRVKITVRPCVSTLSPCSYSQASAAHSWCYFSPRVSRSLLPRQGALSLAFLLKQKFYMYGYFASICLCTMRVSGVQGSQNSIRSPWIRITDVCQLPYGCWELNSGPPERIAKALTAEISLQPHLGGIILTSLCFCFLPPLPPATQTGFLCVELLL